MLNVWVCFCSEWDFFVCSLVHIICASEPNERKSIASGEKHDGEIMNMHHAFYAIPCSSVYR